MSAAGVSFSGDRAVGYEANLRSRIASRVLRRVGVARYRSDDDLYRLANRCEWEHWFDASMTMRVDVSAVRSPLRSLNFVTLRIKDGIVDRFRNATGNRPSIDTVHPVVRIQAFLKEEVATLYLDLSGEPLFKRGWRSERDDKGEAPLKENLAAGLLALAGWKPGTPLYDPFCGSGTVLIEAAQIACHIPPGMSRRFGFESLLDHDEKLWSELRSRAHREARAADDGLFAGSDADPLAIEQTRRNAQHAGLPEGLIKLELRDIAAARSPFPGTGTIITNPPYGERLELRGTPNPNDGWTEIGRVLRKQFGGWRVFVLTTDLQLPELLAMKEKRRSPLYNGALECRLFGFEIFWPREAAPAASETSAPD